MTIEKLSLCKNYQIKIMPKRKIKDFFLYLQCLKIVMLALHLQRIWYRQITWKA